LYLFFWYYVNKRSQHIPAIFAFMSLPTLTIDILIFAVFFLLNIVVGFRYRGKRQSFREFAVGDKNFSTATLTATILATWISGGALFSNLNNTYQEGLYYIIASIIGTFLGLLIIGYVVGPRMDKFLHSFSVPDILGKLYGKKVQSIAGIATVLRSTSYVAMQFQIMARMLSILFNYEGPEVVAAVAILVTLYSLSGGVKAVTFTDILQFFTFGALLPILALTIWDNLQGPSQVMHLFQTHSHFSVRKVVRWSPKFIDTLISMAYLMTPALQPQLFQRMVMARDTKQIKHSFGYAAIVCLGIELCMIWIAIMILAERPDLEANEVMQHIVNTHTYPGLKGLLGIGVIALCMSTADSVLNSCAVIIANDILPPLGLQKESSLRAAKWSTLLLGMLGLVIALSVRNLFQLLLGAAHFYVPNVAPAPVLLTIFGFQTSRRVVLMAMGAGATATAACLFYFTSIHSFFPSILTNLITMLALHYLLGEKGGWQSLAPDDPLTLERAARRQAWQWRLQTIRNFRLYPYLKQNLPTQESFYFFFALYTMAATYTAFYTIGDGGCKDYQPIYTSIYYIVLPITTAFLTFPIWPDRIKKSRFTTYAWPIGIGIILFFAGTLLAIISGFHHMQVMVLMIHLLMAVLMLHWPLALFLAFTGSYAAVVFFNNYTGQSIPLSAVGGLQIFYFLLFVSLALMGQRAYRSLVVSCAQLRKEMSFINQLSLTTMRQQAQLQHEAKLHPLKETACTDSWKAPRHAPLQNSTRTQRMATNTALEQRIYELDTLNKHLQQALHLACEPMHLVVENIVLDVLWQDVRQSLYQYNPAIQIIIKPYTKTKSLQGDGNKMRRLLQTAVAYASTYPDTQRPILIWVGNTQLAYPIMSIPGYVKYVEALCIVVTTEITLPILKKSYLGSVDHGSLPWPQDMEELSLIYNQQIVAAHYGATEMVSTATGVTQAYVFPRDVRTVRPSTMDQWQVATLSEGPDKPVYPAEEAFVQQVLARTPMEPRLLQEAIQLIKKSKPSEASGKEVPSYLHPIAVSSILLTYTQDPDTLLAALLHDAIDTTSLSWHYIALRFNPVIKRIVEGVTSVDSRLSSFKKIQLSNQEMLHKLLEVKDERVLYVKSADRLHHTRMMGSHIARTQQRKVIEETLQFYVPLATRLGLRPIAEELRQLCTKALNALQRR
jgi:Na+/proline symporter